MLDAFEKDLDIDASHINSKVAEIIGSAMEKRSGIYEYLNRKVIPGRYRDEATQLTPYTMTDPVSGQRYGTNRWAAIQAHDEIAKRNLYKILGGSAALGGAYGLISAGLRRKGLGKLKPLVGATMGAIGLTNMPSMGSHYMTDQGVPIPVLTELTKISADTAGLAKSLALPLFGTLSTMALLGMDRKNRESQGYIPGDPYQGMGRRGLDALSSAASEYPLLFAGLGTAGLRAAGNTRASKFLSKHIVKPTYRKVDTRLTSMSDKLKNWAKKTDSQFKNQQNNIKTSADTVLLPPIDMDKVAESLGELLFTVTLWN
jgi:hypothetical protein